MPKRMRLYKTYLLRVTFGKLIKKWTKFKKARLSYTTRVKKVPIQKKDTIVLVFTSKTSYEKAKKILA